MTKTKSIPEAFVHPAHQHFLISFSQEYDSDWQPVSLLSYTSSVDELRLCLLHDQLEEDILSQLNTELDFYLFSKGESDPVGYLHYHVSTQANNIYSKIHFSFLDNITVSTLGYYARIQSMLKRKDLEYTQNSLNNAYLQTIMLNLQDMAALSEKNEFQNVFCRENLPMLYKSIFNKLPKNDEFAFTTIPDENSFAEQWGLLSLKDVCCFLAYLYVCGFMNGVNVVKALRLYHLLV